MELVPLNVFEIDIHCCESASSSGRTLNIQRLIISTAYTSYSQRQWTLLVIAQNNCKHKNLLGNELWRAVDSIKHCGKRLPLK